MQFEIPSKFSFKVMAFCPLCSNESSPLFEKVWLGVGFVLNVVGFLFSLSLFVCLCLFGIFLPLFVQGFFKVNLCLTKQRCHAKQTSPGSLRGWGRGVTSQPKVCRIPFFFPLTENLGESHERMKRNNNTAIINPEKLSARSKLLQFAQNTTFQTSQTRSIPFSGSLTVTSKLIP